VLSCRILQNEGTSNLAREKERECDKAVDMRKRRKGNEKIINWTVEMRKRDPGNWDMIALATH